MFTQYSHDHLPPTTPPSAPMYDGVSIIRPSMSTSYQPVEEYEEAIQHPSCLPYIAPYQLPPPPINPSAFSIPPTFTASSIPHSAPLSPVYSRPSPFARLDERPLNGYYDQAQAGPSRPTHLKTMSDESNPGLISDESDEMLGSKKPVDMGMAHQGSVAAQAGFQTPLATYAAQMVVWLWYGHHTPLSNTSNSPASASSLLSSPNPFDITQSPTHPPIHPLQVTPSPRFASFVSKLLQVTMVSHSVTLIALLYIYRLKLKNNIKAEPGSEHRPFVASLILANKYLDDNTYTNKTWSELASLNMEEVNRMEAEFLRGMSYDLGVERSEYLQWRNLLDGFILARQREAAQRAHERLHRPSWSPQTYIYTPTAPGVPSMPTEATMTPYGFTTRARSASPPLFSPSAANVNDQVPTYAFPSPATKKRSAVAAFNVDPGPAEVYEHMRLPARKAQLHIQPSNGADSSNGSGLGRSSSLSRQIARMPSSLSSSRRGSVGNHHYTHTPSASDDLRHAAMLSKWHSEEYAHYNHQQLPHPPQGQVPLVTSVPHPSFPYNDYSALVAPYQGQAQPQMVPPEHLVFYTLAAEAHPGQDGQPRKAILRYQNPVNSTVGQYQMPYQLPPPTSAYPSGESVYMYDEQLPLAGSVTATGSSVQQQQPDFVGYTFPTTSSHGYPASTGHPHQQMLPTMAYTAEVDPAYGLEVEDHPMPQPGQFANAGPPGYAYAPSDVRAQGYNGDGLGISGINANGWKNGYALGAGDATASAGATMGDQGQEPAAQDGLWRTRSQWNSPMPGQFDPRAQGAASSSSPLASTHA